MLLLLRGVPTSYGLACTYVAIEVSANRFVVRTYEIVARVRAGGMGEVWRARDTRLDRDVAVKILTPAMADEPDRLRMPGSR